MCSFVNFDVLFISSFLRKQKKIGVLYLQIVTGQEMIKLRQQVLMLALVTVIWSRVLASATKLVCICLKQNGNNFNFRQEQKGYNHKLMKKNYATYNRTRTVPNEETASINDKHRDLAIDLVINMERGSPGSWSTKLL